MSSLRVNSIPQLIGALKDKEHIIWDWNGTLLDDVDHAIQSMNHLLDDHGLPKLEKDRYRQVFEFPVQNYYRSLGFDFKKESFENLCHRFVAKFMEGFKLLPLVPAMQSILFEFYHLGKTQSVLSASSQHDLEEMIEHFDLGSIFAHVYGVDNKYGSSKIERGIQLLEESGISKSDTVIIGDTLHDLEVGEALGIDVVLLAHGHQCGQKLRARHDKVIELGIYAV
ncbi:MAG: HAD family hydrolase [Bdellovibrionota bacterium]